MIDGNDNDDTIEQALSNLNKDESEDDSTTSSSNDSSLFEPEVEEPEEEERTIGQGGTLYGTNRPLERKCRKYAREFIAGETEYTPLNIDMTKIEWRVSKKMTSASGRCKYHKPKRGWARVKISQHLIENADWERVKETIRHELVHVWQKQSDEPTGHGWSFKKWCDPLDISVRADNPATQEHKYEIHCPQCGKVGGRQRMCKSIKQVVNQGRRYCQNCGKDSKGDLFVKKDGRELNRV